MHLSPIRYKITLISDTVLTQLYFSVHPTMCRTLGPVFYLPVFMLSLTGIMLCFTCTAWGEAKIRAPRDTKEGQVSTKDEVSLDMREACS